MGRNQTRETYLQGKAKITLEQIGVFFCKKTAAFAAAYNNTQPNQTFSLDHARALGGERVAANAEAALRYQSPSDQTENVAI